MLILVQIKVGVQHLLLYFGVLQGIFNRIYINRISIVMLTCFYKRIYLAIAVIKAAADFSRDVC